MQLTFDQNANDFVTYKSMYYKRMIFCHLSSFHQTQA